MLIKTQRGTTRKMKNSNLFLVHSTLEFFLSKPFYFHFRMGTMSENFCLALFVFCLSFQNARCNSHLTVEELFSDYFEWKMATHPQAATMAGYHMHLDQLDDLSLDALLDVGIKCHHFQQRALEILEWKELEARDKFYVKILEDEARMCYKGMAYRGYLLPPVDFLTGVQTTLPSFFGKDNVQQLQNEQDYRDLIRRLKKVPKQINQIIDLLKLGVQEGITYSNESMARTKEQFDLLQTPAEASVFYRQFKKAPNKLELSAYSQKIIEIQYEAKYVINEKVLPAFKKLGDYLQSEYMMHLRPNPGISSLPDGAQMYQGFLEYHTSMSGLTPEKIHTSGLQQVDDLKRKMLGVARKLGYGNLNFSTFIDTMRDKPSQQFKSRIEKLQSFESNVYKINAKLSSFFGPNVLHDEVYDVVVKPMPPKEKRRSYYSPPSIDGERQGAFYINVDDISALKKYETMSLTLHESNPGHHLMETFTKYSELPNFLKFRIDSWYEPSATPSYTAFVEGWGQYAEHLGYEMKIFDEDPHQLIGYYSYNLVRSLRLVLDTGIHALGWSRQKSIDYLYVNTAMSLQNCVYEIDRYITKPGQAAAYKIGEQRILQLRRKFEAKEGRAYDLKNFHWHFLSCMGPLESLEECIDERASHFARGHGTASKHHTSNILTSIFVIIYFWFC